MVLRVLRRATKTGEPTDTSRLGEQVRLLYPGHYPIDPAELQELVDASVALGTGRDEQRLPPGGAC